MAKMAFTIPRNAALSRTDAWHTDRSAFSGISGRDTDVTSGNRFARLTATLARFRDDARGNVLMLVAAATIPLMAMIGAGVDMARAYTVQARLQQACDAASLAGRRAMLHDVIDDDVRTEANKFFNFNFPQRMYGTSGFSPVIERPSSGAVKITARTTLPTTVMKILGFQQLDIGTDCIASQDFINVDVMLVVDVTGSMNQTLPDGKKRIEALRAAVLALYDQLKPTQDFLEGHGYRLRYSILPYSQTVNVGKLLYAANTKYIRNPGRYTQMTCCTVSNGVYTIYANRSNGPTQTDGWFKSTWSGCIEERQTLATAGTTPTVAELADPRMKDLSINGAPDAGDPNSQWQPYDPSRETLNGDSSGEACPNAAALFKTWTRADLKTYVDGLAPVGATYHDVGMLWGARMLSASGPLAASPDAFNGMRTNKYMVFLTDGEMEPSYSAYSAYGFEIVDRRINGGGERSSYSTNESLNDQALTDRHNGRFRAACTAARNTPAQVYVIALAVGVTQPMNDCVNNNPDRVKTAANQSQLIAQFAQIGQDISELRLSQ